VLETVLGIQILMFLGLQDPDPDPLVRGTDPGLDPTLKILPFSHNDCKIGFTHKNFSKKFKFLRLKIMCLRISYKNKI
jgi:hypothetical protein